MPIKESLFDVAEHQRDKILHKGFDYKGQVFKRSMSNYLFRDELRSGILAKMEDVVYNLIELVKDIKNHFNYVVPKNYRNKN